MLVGSKPAGQGEGFMFSVLQAAAVLHESVVVGDTFIVFACCESVGKETHRLKTLATFMEVNKSSMLFLYYNTLSIILCAVIRCSPFTVRVLRSRLPLLPQR